jgi:hypothetical protein
MGRAFEVITGRALNPGAGPTALVANTGDSFAVRSTPMENPPKLEGIWAFAATAGLIQVRSPRLHDQTQGIRFEVVASTARNFLPDEATQQLYPQDVLVFEIGGGAAETDVGALAIYYPDLPGIDARLVMWDQISSRVANILTARVAITPPATAGDWSAGTALNATTDLLKANVDYAVLGYAADGGVAAIALKGPDTGNLRVGGPGTNEAIETRDWFIGLSKAKGSPHIPIINAANKAPTLAHVCKATAAGNTIVDFVLAELKP